MPPTSSWCPSCGTVNGTQAAFCSNCGTPLHGGPALSGLPLGGTGRLAPKQLLKQQYRIVALLGQGGMGAVYKAEDTRFNNRFVAVKEMSQSGLSQKETTAVAEQFKQEADILAGLQHPNLPRIYDHFGENGRWYLVMDFIEGSTLGDRLNKAKGHVLPIAEAVDIGIQLTKVLGHLHTRPKPIIFRDLKPSNVMLTLDDHVYLIDFGIARLFKPGQAKDTLAYASPGYAAPEQFGQAQTIPQSDIYSLGVTLHQLLSGHDPSSNTPTLWAFKPVQSYNPAIPSTLATLVMQMVNVDPHQRPANMKFVQQELAHIQSQLRQPIASPSLLPGGSARILPQLPAPVICSYHQHPAAIRSLSWSPDGTQIVSTSGDKTVHVWDATTGRNLHLYQDIADLVQVVAWSPGNMRIATAGGDVLRVWDMVTNRLVATYSGHAGSTINAMAWSPKQPFLASTDKDGTVHIWNATTGQPITIYRGHSGSVNAVAWSPDGENLVSGGDDASVQIWVASEGRTIATHRGQSANVLSTAWSPNMELGSRVACGRDNGIVQIWETATNREVILYRYIAPVLVVAWSPDGRRFAFASGDNIVQVWNTTTNLRLFIFQHTAPVYVMAWSPDGQYIASGGDDAAIQVWVAP